jgi:hypothetical protein
MDPLHLAVAFVPLALYLLGLGVVHLRRRPIVWSGTLDTTLLAAAVAGFVIVGPMELFMPDSLPLPGGYVWLLMLSVYTLSVTLWNLLARPRLVVFHLSAEQLRPLLAEVVRRMDSQAGSTGDCFLLPQIGVQFHIEYYPPLRNVCLAAIGDRQSFSGWRRLQAELATALRRIKIADGRQGYGLIAVGLLMIVAPLCLLIGMGGAAVEQKFRDLLREPAASDPSVHASPPDNGQRTSHDPRQ